MLFTCERVRACLFVFVCVIWRIHISMYVHICSVGVKQAMAIIVHYFCTTTVRYLSPLLYVNTCMLPHRYEYTYIYSMFTLHIEYEYIYICIPHTLGIYIYLWDIY